MANYFTERDLLHYQNSGLLVWETEGRGGRHEIHVIDISDKMIFTRKKDFDDWVKNKFTKTLDKS